MPDPHSDAYEKYRIGIIKRHIICSGRFVSKLYLKEYTPNIDHILLFKHSREFRSPLILCHLWEKYLNFHFENSMQSHAAPSLLINGNRLYLTWTDASNKKICIKYTDDGSTWKWLKRDIPETSDYSPSIVFFKGKYYIAWTGRDTKNHINIISSPDGINWSQKKTFYNDPKVTSLDGPCLAIGNNQLILAWTDKKKHIKILRSNDGQTWTFTQKLSNETTKHSPSIIYFNQKFFISWTGTDKENHVNIISSTDLINWNNKKTFKWSNRNCKSNDSPKFMIIDNELFLIWSDSNWDTTRWISTNDGVNWDIERQICAFTTNYTGLGRKNFIDPWKLKTIYAPSLVKFKGQYFHAWTHTQSNVFCKPLNIIQDTITRIYIPWMKQKELYGGCDNPLLRGGLAMATFAIEYMVKGDQSSLRYAELLLRYFEKCEVKNPVGTPIGFFIRCEHFVDTKELELHASMDEIIGLVLGLYYLYLAIEYKDSNLLNRVREMMNRLGSNLQANGYLIIPPLIHTNLTKEYHNTFHRGSAGLFFNQWALEQAFFRVTGKDYRSTQSHYKNASIKIWNFFSENPITTGMKIPLDIIGMTYLWIKNSLVDDSVKDQLSNFVTHYFQKALANVLSGKDPDYTGNDVRPLAEIISTLLFPGVDYDTWFIIMILFVAINGIKGIFEVTDSLKTVYRLISLFDELETIIHEIADPYKRYLMLIRFYEISIKLDTESVRDNWFNFSLLRHTLHYAFDKHVDDPIKKEIAIFASDFIFALLGNRIGKDKRDDDFYAAIMAKGLLNKYLESFPSGVYIEWIDQAIETRESMWEDLPVGEPAEYRDFDWDKLKFDWDYVSVRWHNHKYLNEYWAKIGAIHCWDWPDPKRVIGRGHVGDPDAATGMDYKTIIPPLEEKKDIIYETAGLGYMFPRVLMSYWLNEPLNFVDPEIPPLRTVVCLPFSKNGKKEFLRANCKHLDNLLLFSTTFMS